MTDWRSSTSTFHPRLHELMANGESDRHMYSEVPTAPFPKMPSEREVVFYRSVSALIGAYRSSDEMKYTFVENFKSGLFVAASLSSRALIELSGIPRYVENEIIAKYERDPSNTNTIRRLDRLTQGANGEVPLPWGGISQLNPINAMEFVRAADAVEDYDWLCNASHPSMLHHTYLYFAGRFGDNWSNDSFAEHGRSVLERLVTITESSWGRLVEDTSRIIGNATPVLNQIG